jgi:hypothetical protein
MSEEEPAFLNRQPKWSRPAFYGLIFLSGIFLCMPVAQKLLTAFFVQHKHTPWQQPRSNAGQLWYALTGFNEEYGSFPNEKTATLVEKDFPTNTDLSVSSSNALFRQLFVSDQVDSEEIFFTKTPGSIRPDGDTTPGHLLEKGEVGFAYISGLSGTDDPTSPLLLAPLIPGTTKFDPKPFKGKAVVLKIDKSVEVYENQKDGHIYRDGIDLLSPKHPVWKGKAPDIRYPE